MRFEFNGKTIKSKSKKTINWVTKVAGIKKKKKRRRRKRRY